MTSGVIIALVARGMLAALFAFAAASKLRDRSQTRAQLRAAGISPGFDLTLVVFEAFTAFGIIMERRSAWSVYVAIALLTGFSAFVLYQVLTGNRAPCPCFGSGPASRPTDVWTLVRNLILLAIAVVATGATGIGQWVIWLVAVSGFVLLSVVNGVSARAGR